MPVSRRLFRGGGGKVLVLLIILLSFDWLSRAIGLGFSVSGFGSHTFATFMIVYCAVRLIVGCVKYDNVSRANLAVLCGVLLLVYEAAIILYGRIIGAKSVLEAVGDWGFYNCPLVVAIAMALFAAMERIMLPRFVNAIISFISPSMFAVYLISEASPVGKRLLLGNMVGDFGVLGGAALVFVSCILVDLAMRRLPILIIRRYFLNMKVAQ